MEIIRLEKSGRGTTPCVATIGMFDGVHRGHRFVLSHICEEAKKEGMASCVITFDRHPREVVQTGWTPQLLSTFDERMRLLAETGVERCVVIPFTEEMAQMSAHDFMQLMSQQMGVKVLMTGYDNRFGHDRTATFDDYVRYGEEMGMKVKGLPPLDSLEFRVDSLELKISSSIIRKLLGEGRVAEAAEALNGPYCLEGQVVKGEHVGTGLGFPTANLQPTDLRKIIPAPGVYAVRCLMDDGRGKKDDVRCMMYKGMMNIGTRPTFGEHQQTLEVHILHYEGDLYGQTIRVEFVERLRDERRFENEEELKRQLKEDERRVESLKLRVESL